MATARTPVRRRTPDRLLGLGTATAAVVTAAAMFAIGAFIAASAWPSLRYNGWTFLTSHVWDAGNSYGSGTTVRNGVAASPGASFGILVYMFGTVASSALAMLVATPLAILVAVAIAYRLPKRLELVVNTLVELMAGVPSVVYGLWGIVVLVPFIGSTLGPVVTGAFGTIPFFSGSSGSGYGLVAAALVLAIMVLPIMAATMRDLVKSVPEETLEASMALGANFWQTVTRVALPSVRAGMLGAGLLALGRALGETMAVLMVSGGAQNQFPSNVFSPINTMAAVIVSQLDSALTDASGLSVSALAETALVLFAMTLLVNVIARYIVSVTARARISL